MKIHTLLDSDGCMLSYIFMTTCKHSDVKHARQMTLPKYSVVEMDRGYQSFKMFWEWTINTIFFVTRLRDWRNYVTVAENNLTWKDVQHIIKDGNELTEVESRSNIRYSSGVWQSIMQNRTG